MNLEPKLSNFEYKTLGYYDIKITFLIKNREYYLTKHGEFIESIGSMFYIMSKLVP